MGIECAHGWHAIRLLVSRVSLRSLVGMVGAIPDSSGISSTSGCWRRRVTSWRLGRLHDLCGRGSRHRPGWIARRLGARPTHSVREDPGRIAFLHDDFRARPAGSPAELGAGDAVAGLGARAGRLTARWTGSSPTGT